MKRKFLIISFCVMFIIFLAFLFINKKPTITIGETVPFATGASSGTILARDDFIIFSNGLYLVKYNTRTGGTERLSSTTGLPYVSKLSLSPNSKFLLFETATSAE